jgi:hypothetical protein
VKGTSYETSHYVISPSYLLQLSQDKNILVLSTSFSDTLRVTTLFWELSLLLELEQHLHGDLHDFLILLYQTQTQLILPQENGLNNIRR